ncbi:MAG: hypothetical protein Q8K35_05275 [Thiobacillus sp.]|nr:hypothetical protein [Thiobacillus sp.]
MKRLVWLRPELGAPTKSNRRASSQNRLINRRIGNLAGLLRAKNRAKRRSLATPNPAGLENDSLKQKDRRN